MNIGFYQNNPNQWVATDESGKVRFIKTNDISDEELKNILLKEDELELLINEKDNLLKEIDKINKFDIEAQKENRFFKLLIVLTAVVCFDFLFLMGFNLINVVIMLMASIIPVSLCAAFKLRILEDFGTKKGRAKEKNENEERLAKLIEREPKLVEEINNLKKKYHFEEENKKVTYFSISELRKEMAQENSAYSIIQEKTTLKRVRRKNIQ